ncbi:alpha/beta fold hydrolase [Deinococcus misasensis]|uniref:alpha/beta fold hydrolase n=1 Tax=Deinococcus misasensis TaxID=392413 RepID=UPI000557FD4C|nr:alpha/beta hydrolase [Deinococcus misasensis]
MTVSAPQKSQTHPVVFLHGAGITSWMWEDLLQGLSGVDAFSPDLPVFDAQFTLEHTARALLANIEQRFSGEKVHLVGHSLGGVLTLKLLELQAEQFHSAVVMGATVLPMGQLQVLLPVMEWMLPLNQTPLMLTLAARAMQVPPHQQDRFIHDQQRMTRAALRQVMQEVNRYRIPEALSNCEVPVLALVGSQEVAVNQRSATELVKRLPNAQMKTIPKGHHAWFVQFPKLFTEIVQTWLAQNSQQHSPQDLQIGKA